MQSLTAKMAASFRLCSLSKPKTALIVTNTSLPSKSFLKPTPISKSSTLRLFATSPKPLKPVAAKTLIRSLFTGIVEEMGEVKTIGPTSGAGDGFDLTIAARTVIADVKLGDSISVNGTCLTVTRFDSVDFTVGLAPETLRKTSLSELSPGSRVNLERAVTPATRLGGHFVQGHVDGTGVIAAMVAEEDSLWITVKTTREILKYVVPKGFIAVDGTSLTVVDVSDDESSFSFMLVAYTQENVVIPSKKVGEKVNLEVDILGKYVERLLGSGFVDNVKSS